MEQYVSAGEAARILGVTYRVLLYRIKKGKLPATKVGYGWIIKKSDLETP